VKRFALITFTFLALAVGYSGFQAVRHGPEGRCGVGLMPAGANYVKSDWTWIPPGWDCVYLRYPANGPYEIVERR
jgi:hypothetical protein